MNVKLIKYSLIKFLLSKNDENYENKYTMMDKFNEFYKSDRRAHLCISDVTLR